MKYTKLRKIITTALRNNDLADKITKVYSDKSIKLDIEQIVDLVESSNIDVIVIETMTEKSIDKVSDKEAFEVMADFFLSIRENLKSLTKLLKTLGFQAQVEKTNTP
jgi:isocitrate dehydrogenase kinase/phosphatase